jgi:hypothetical protein
MNSNILLPGETLPFVRAPRVESADDMKILRDTADHLFSSVADMYPKHASKQVSFRPDSNRSERFVWIDIKVWPSGDSVTGSYIALPSIKISGIRPDGRPRFYSNHRSLGLDEISKVFVKHVRSGKWDADDLQ